MNCKNCNYLVKVFSKDKKDFFYGKCIKYNCPYLKTKHSEIKCYVSSCDQFVRCKKCLKENKMNDKEEKIYRDGLANTHRAEIIRVLVSERSLNDNLKKENAKLKKENFELTNSTKNFREVCEHKVSVIKRWNQDSRKVDKYIDRLKKELSESNKKNKVLDKAFDLVCDYTSNNKHHDFELFHKITGGLVLGTIAFKKALKEYYLKEARGIK